MTELAGLALVIAILYALAEHGGHKKHPEVEHEREPEQAPPHAKPAAKPKVDVKIGPATDVHPSTPRAGPAKAPTAAPSGPAKPKSILVKTAAPAPPAWPQVVPKDLPAFPSGWEPDTPVKPDVQKRAAALIKELWKSGKPGAKKVEKTGDHWVTYLAFVPSKGKKGVAAYRPKAGATHSVTV